MSANSIFQSFLASQGSVFFDHLGGGNFRVIGDWPTWCANIWSAQPGAGKAIRLGDQSPFLENFLVDADGFWKSKLEDSVDSGNWIERGSDGQEIPLEASAYSLQGRPVLVVRNLSRRFAEKQEW